MKKPWIQCLQCIGHGEIPMPLILWQSLQIIRKRPGITTGEIYDKLNKPGVGMTAICNRVRSLERNGFVERDGKRGKNWLWKAKAAVK